MKKKLILAMAVIAAMVSCQKEVDPVAISQTDGDAVSFSVYANTAVTRGAVNSIQDFYGSGIGVFAFYQPAVNGAAGPGYSTFKYPTPDFMYNEHIKCTNQTTSKWTYAPIKYWPNDTNAKLSFFAYAPYKAGTTWEDLGISTDVTGKTVTKTFDIYNEVADQKDYLFAAPSLNLSKPKTITQTYGYANSSTANYSSGSDVIKFDFKHITSKVNLFVGVLVDNTNPSTTDSLSSWTDSNTKIIIKSIEFKDLATTRTLTYNVNTKYETWVSAGKQDITVIPAHKDNADTIQATGSWKSDKRWHRVLSTKDISNPNDTTDLDEYMFIAPQTTSELTDSKIIITYVVETTDANLYGGKSEVTNVITKSWTDFVNAGFNGFNAGYQYKLYFMIGVQGVKLAATVTEWDTNPSSHTIDVPTAAK